MFINNKYKRWYDNIIKNAKSQSRILDYYEKHHIIPKSLGGDDSENNLVNLTAREHFICHFLLTKFTTGQDYYKMVYACKGMNRSRKYQKRYINSKLYEIIKTEAAKIQSKKFKGKPLSKDHKSKISKSGKGRVNSIETIEKRRLANTGKKRTAEQKEKMRIAQLNRKKKTPEEKAAISAKASEKLKGRKLGSKSEETKKKLSVANKGRSFGPKSEETKQKMRKPKSESHRKAISEGRKAKYSSLKN